MSRLLRTAGSMSCFTLLSRVLGLWRDRLMFTTLGDGWVQGTFLLAWMLPNLMRRLLGEGALSASLIPAYARLRSAEGKEPARRLLASVVGVTVLILLPLCALVAIGGLLWPSSWLPATAAGEGKANPLLLQLNAILFPYALPVCLTAIFSGALNTLGRFALPAAVPIALNLVWIAALYLAPVCGITVDTEVATFVAVFLAIGGVLQLLFVIVPLRRAGELLRPTFAWPQRGTPARAVFVTMVPTAIGMSLTQVSSLLDQAMAYYLIAPGANAYVYGANRLLLFPHALTAISVAVAVFPKLAADAGANDRVALRKTLDLAASATIFVTLPAAVGMIVLGEDVVRLLYEGGKFKEQAAHATTVTTQYLLAGLPFLGLAQLYARAFYAIGDTKPPARLAAYLVITNAVLNYVLVTTTEMGTAALTLASSLSALVNALVLGIGFRRHAGRGTGFYGAWLRNIIATAVMCLTIWLTKPPASTSHTSKLDLFLWHVGLPILIGVFTYLLTHVLMRSPELSALRRKRR
ncbi:MAG: murein biosynthesis integral membrane protein MurJ [Planctomycetota bacterium]|nr:murein biosynthesis integral membrane protein MurJ [Planctomycetota bacterium]